MKRLLLLFTALLVIVSCAQQSSQYYDEVLYNIVRNTANGTMSADGRKEVIINELSRLSYESALRALEDLPIIAPKVLKGIKSEVRQKIDEQYKESLLDGYNDQSIPLGNFYLCSHFYYTLSRQVSCKNPIFHYALYYALLQNLMVYLK